MCWSVCKCGMCRLVGVKVGASNEEQLAGESEEKVVRSNASEVNSPIVLCPPRAPEKANKQETDGSTPRSGR